MKLKNKWVLTAVAGASLLAVVFLATDLLHPGVFRHDSMSPSIPGATPNEAARVVPLEKTISLMASSGSDGVVLEWQARERPSYQYFDVYRIKPNSVGWGDRIARIEISDSSRKTWRALDEPTTTGTRTYLVVGVRLVAGYEIKDSLSNKVEINLPD